MYYTDFLNGLREEEIEQLVIDRYNIHDFILGDGKSGCIKTK
jgi:predicted SnoaL-like aldol condensation-catalyzing enzyme